MGNTTFPTRLLKYILLFIVIINIYSNTLSAQADNQLWKINFQYLNISPQVFNNPWFVTPNEIHLHPTISAYTPGIKFSFERKLYNCLGLEAAIVYGYPKISHSLDGLPVEIPDAERRFNYIALLFSSNIYIFSGQKTTFYTAPIFGIGIISRKKLNEEYGPTVLYGGDNGFTCGVKFGFTRKLKHPSLLINSELVFMKMNIHIKDNLHGKKSVRNFGPVSLGIGISYLF